MIYYCLSLQVQNRFLSSRLEVFFLNPSKTGVNVRLKVLLIWYNFRLFSCARSASNGLEFKNIRHANKSSFQDSLHFSLFCTSDKRSSCGKLVVFLSTAQWFCVFTTIFYKQAIIIIAFTCFTAFLTSYTIIRAQTYREASLTWSICTDLFPKVALFWRK